VSVEIEWVARRPGLRRERMFWRVEKDDAGLPVRRTLVDADTGEILDDVVREVDLQAVAMRSAA
jgi:hypothetical protein